MKTLKIMAFVKKLQMGHFSHEGPQITTQSNKAHLYLQLFHSKTFFIRWLETNHDLKIHAALQTF